MMSRKYMVLHYPECMCLAMHGYIIIPNSTIETIGYLERLNSILYVDKEHIITESNAQDYQGIIGILITYNCDA